MRISLLGSVFLGVLLPCACASTGCLSLLPGGNSPPLHLVTVVADPPLEPMMPPREPVRLKITRFQVDSLIQRTEILVRSSRNPSDVRYLASDRWADFPSALVTECMREHLGTSGGVGIVLPSNWRGQWDALLRGRILRFEAVELENLDWSAHLVLDLWVECADGRETVFERIAISSPCEASKTSELAKSLSAAIREAAQRVIPQLRVELQPPDFRPAVPFDSIPNG